MKRERIKSHSQRDMALSAEKPEEIGGGISKKFVITSLAWERVFLRFSIKAEYSGDVAFHMVKLQDEGLAEEVIDIQYDRYLNQTYFFVLNITAMHGRTFLDNGEWVIVASTTEGSWVCAVDCQALCREAELSRIFRYGRGKYAYTVSFNPYADGENNLTLICDSYFMISNKKWKKRKYIQEALTLKGKFSRAGLYAVILLIRLYYQVAEHLSPKRGKNIMFMSETKDHLTGNLKYIYDRLKARGLDQEFCVTHSYRQAVGNHMSILSWLKLVTNIARQDFIFIDDYVPVFGFFNLNKRTKLIQVWHAGEGFKSVGYSRFGKSGTPFPAGSCHKKYTHVLTGSRKLIHVFEEVFGIEKEAFYPLGMPRLDDFLDPQTIQRFKERFFNDHPQLEGKKIILFAPTYRGAGQSVAYYDNTKLDLKEIYQFCKEEYVFLFKMHPFITDPIQIPTELQDRIYDFSSYPNINELYYVTDLLITDYSSNYFEYALMKRPVLFYTYDREIYELTRGVHRSVKEHAPGKVCDTFEELMETLRAGDFQVEKIEHFVEENFGEYDGHASDKVIDQILLGKNSSL